MKELSPWERSVAVRVGRLVRHHRELRNISRETVGDWLSQTTDSVAKAEAGKRRFSVADLMRISLEFGVKLDDLVYGDEPRPQVLRVISLDRANEPLANANKSPAIRRKS